MSANDDRYTTVENGWMYRGVFIERKQTPPGCKPGWCQVHKDPRIYSGPNWPLIELSTVKSAMLYIDEQLDVPRGGSWPVDRRRK
jgi:hypothetical protein